MTPDPNGAHDRVNLAIAKHNARIGEEISRFKTEYRKQLIARAHEVGMPQSGIDYLRRGRWA